MSLNLPEPSNEAATMKYSKFNILKTLRGVKLMLKCGMGPLVDYMYQFKLLDSIAQKKIHERKSFFALYALTQIK